MRLALGAIRMMSGLALLLGTLAGCSMPLSRDPMAGEWLQQDPSSWQMEGSPTWHSDATVRVVAATQPATTQSSAALPADAGPQDYVRLALARNPSIRAAQRRVERLWDEVPQAESLDDPVFQVAPIGEMAQTAAGEVSLMTSLSQKLPFPGKRDTRGRIAAQSAAMARQDLASTRLSVMGDTRKAYWSYFYAQQAIEVTQDSRDLLEQFQATARAKYQAGTATQQDVLRASVELSNLDNQLITLKQRRTTAVAMLNSLMDRPIDAALPAPRKVKLGDVTLSLDSLLAQAARTNPDLRKIHDRIEMYRQKLRLARLNRWPDLTLGLTYNAVEDQGLAPMANGKDQWWLGFGINLPIWQDKLNAAENGALQGVLEGVGDLTAKQNELAFRIQDAAVRVDTQHRQALLFRDVIVPQAQQTVEVSQSAYQAGRLDFLTLVDNWRKLLDYELMYQQNLSQYEQSVADLEQVVGADVAGAKTAGPAQESGKDLRHGK